MKQIIILSIIALFCAVVIPMQAQSGYGIEVGGVLNDIRASNVDAKIKVTYKAGGFINYAIHGYDILGAGIYYVKRSAKMSGFIPQYAGYIQTMDVSMNYIEILPFSIRFNKLAGGGKKLKIIPIASIYLAYAFSGEGSLTGVDENNRIFAKQIDNIFDDIQFVENNINYDLKRFQPFDMGAKLGVDFVYNNKFIYRLNWSTGGINFSSYDKAIKNNSLELSVGYLLK
jgi:hypothetical protein